METVADFKKAIEVISSRRSKIVFQSSSELHACIVIANLIRTSDKCIYLYDSTLNGDIVEQDRDYFLVHLTHFLSRGGELNIVLNSFDCESPTYTLFASLSTIFKNKVNVRETNSEFSEKLTQLLSQRITGFVVNDHAFYRLERTKMEDGSRDADFSFYNDSSIGKQLLDFSRKNFDVCKQHRFEVRHVLI